jgi:lysophospholipase L1-like esterase
MKLLAPQETGQDGNASTVVAYGDSTTAPRESLVVYADHLKQDLLAMQIKSGVINAGVGGNTTEDAKLRFEKDVMSRHPDLVIIQFGINDAAVDVWKNPPSTTPRVARDRYERNLEYFIQMLRERKSEIILMTPNPMQWNSKLKALYGKPPYRVDETDGFNVLLRQYAEAVRVIAKEKNVPLVDVYAAHEVYGRVENQSQSDLLLDGEHPNNKGQRLVADLLIQKILEK